MKSTKKNIRNAALKLFNEKGFVNVRLQHIANEASLSIGNLAYHFSTKEVIVMALYEDLARKHELLLAE